MTIAASQTILVGVKEAGLDGHVIQPQKLQESPARSKQDRVSHQERRAFAPISSGLAIQYIRASSARFAAPVFSMTCARWISTVR